MKRYLLLLKHNIISFLGNFKRGVEVKINHISEFKEDKLEKIPDSINIYIRHLFKKVWYIAEIPIESIPDIINLLKNSKRDCQINLSYGIGAEYIIIPKWAKKSLILELENLPVRILLDKMLG